MITPKRIRAIRDAAGLTQEAFAHLLGVSFVSMNRWEGGHSSPTGAARSILEALDQALAGGADLKELVEEARGREPAYLLYRLLHAAYKV